MMFHKFLKSKNINICTLLFYILFLIGCKKNTVINDKQIKPNNINVDMNKPFIPSFSYGGILTLEQRKYLESQESIDSNHYEIIDYYFDSLTQVDSTDLIVFYKYYLSIPNLEIVDHVCVYTISEEGKILNRYLIPYTDDCFIRNVQQNDFGTKINNCMPEKITKILFYIFMLIIGGYEIIVSLKQIKEGKNIIKEGEN